MGFDGNVWFTEFKSGKIGVIVPATHVITEYTAGAATSEPLGIAMGSDKRLWFTESGGTSIGAITTSGVVTEYNVGVATSHITAGPNQKMWFTAPDDNSIGTINPATGLYQRYGLSHDGERPSGIVEGSDGNIWYSTLGTNMIGKMTSDGTTTEWSIPTSNSNPTDVCLGPDGNVWFVENAGNTIGKITTAGTITEYPLATPYPNGCTEGADGNVWYATNTAIEGITTGGSIVARHPGPLGQKLTAIVQLYNGQIWFTESGATSKIGFISI